MTLLVSLLVAAMLVSGIVAPPVKPGGTVQPEEGKQPVSQETHKFILYKLSHCILYYANVYSV